MARLSRLHAVHLAAKAGQVKALEMEVADWTGREGGMLAVGEWRERLRWLWSAWPRASQYTFG